MSETTNIVELDQARKVSKKEAIKAAVNQELRFEEMLDSEAVRAEADGIDPTVGNVLTLICRVALLSLLGEDQFSIDLSSLDDEAAEAELLKAADVIGEKLGSVGITVAELLEAYKEQDD